ncbi:hypothetical protein ACIGW4_33055 [Streptomyces sp. NPDC053513]|uniref:hypothetical protein n=1 Tax=unclassified Streptomyces TaxID=2593676 RepID=UPI0037D92C5C
MMPRPFRASASTVRFIALLCASAVTALSIAVVIATRAAEEGRDVREARRSPVYVGPADQGAVRAWWSQVFDTVAGVQSTVVFIAPAGADAPLPPGVEAWPAPGEVLLSPALRRAGAGEDIAQRYGRDAGIIGAAGLDTPGELLAYARPASTELFPSGMTGISGYGGRLGSAIGPVLWARPPAALPPVVALLAGLPALALVVCALRAATARREEQPGLPPRGRHIAGLLRTGTLPAALGALLGLAPAVACAFIDLRLPQTAFTLSAVDLRAHLWSLLAAGPIAVCTVLAGYVATDLLRRPVAASRRPARSERVTGWVLIAGALALLVGIQGSGLFPQGSWARAATNWAGATAVVLALAYLAVPATAAWGAWLAPHAGARGLLGAATAARLMTHRPAPVASLFTAVLMGLVVSLQALAWSTPSGLIVSAAAATQARVGTSVVTVDVGRKATAPQLARFLSAQHADTRVVALRPATDGLGPVFQGDCRDLALLRLACPGGTAAEPGALNPGDARLQELLRWNGGGGGRFGIRHADATQAVLDPEARATMVMFSVTGGQLDVPAILQAGYRFLPGGVSARPPGRDWIDGTGMNRQQSQWIALAGSIGTVLLLIAAGIATVRSLLDAPRPGPQDSDAELLPPGTPAATAAWLVLPPLLAALALGDGLGLWLASPMVMSDVPFSSARLVMAFAAGAAVVAAGLCSWAAAVVPRASHRPWALPNPLPEPDAARTG